jgi:hypothetical protein
LKASQAYPVGFGQRLTELFKEHLRERTCTEVVDDSSDSELGANDLEDFLAAAKPDEDMWPDAGMAAVTAWLAAQ